MKITSPCSKCSGTGAVQTESMLKVNIPAGVDNGQTLRIHGRGQPGEKGGRTGNLYVVIAVEDDERFVRDEFDIHSRVEITMFQAALGCAVTAPTLEGEIELDIAPGTQPGDVIHRRGKGIPVLGGRGRGDQHIHVDVSVPKKLSSEQSGLLHQLAESFGDAVSGRKGFVDRLFGR
jgi:molecular chaperone DnaJ